MAAITFGNMGFDSRFVAGEFKDLINEAALHSLRHADRVGDTGGEHRFSSWVTRERQQFVATLLVSVATMYAGSHCIEKAPRTRTVAFVAPVAAVQEDWLAREISLGDVASVEFDQLYAQVKGAAEAALTRLLPATLTEDQARAWAEELVRSCRD